MNKQELVDAVAERLGDRRTAAAAVDAVLGTVTGALASGERVALFGFGVFERVDRAARTARNPATGGTVEVPATAVPRFRPGRALKDAVSGREPGTGRSAPARAPRQDPDAGRTAEPQSERTGAKAGTSSGKDEPAKDEAGKDKPSKDKPSKDKSAKDKSGKDKSAKDKAGKDKDKAGDKPAKDKAGRGRSGSKGKGSG